jgi:hypothetical protein
MLSWTFCKITDNPFNDEILSDVCKKSSNSYMLSKMKGKLFSEQNWFNLALLHLTQ